MLLIHNTSYQVVSLGLDTDIVGGINLILFCNRCGKIVVVDHPLKLLNANNSF